MTSLRRSILNRGRDRRRSTRGAFPATSCSRRGRRRGPAQTTIDAPASAVWPWLAQMGPAPRGGAYTYDWIENLLGLNCTASTASSPSSSTRRSGESVSYGKKRMSYALVEPEQVLSTRSADGNWVWGRFVPLRARRSDAPKSAVIASACHGCAIASGCSRWKPASLVMERKMLAGIKQRAERLDATA